MGILLGSLLTMLDLGQRSALTWVYKYLLRLNDHVIRFMCTALYFAFFVSRTEWASFLLSVQCPKFNITASSKFEGQYLL